MLINASVPLNPPQLEELLPHFITCLEHPYTSVRHMSSRCLGTMCKVITMATMNRLLMEVIPMLGAQEDEVKREGAVEALACILERSHDFSVFLVLQTVDSCGTKITYAHFLKSQ